ncbi:MAG: TolB-like protein/tetratricopeptide (TPR) repeat protein [Sulfitobacter sp.]|jgi:TolB-like protein/tetratricopeptide (TPR) repeat protein
MQPLPDSVLRFLVSFSLESDCRILPSTLYCSLLQSGFRLRSFLVGYLTSQTMALSALYLFLPKNCRAEELPRLRPAHLAQILLFFVLVAVIAALMIERQTTAKPTFEHATGYTIGVVPFENKSLEPDNDYFSDGISEEILNALVGVRELKVASKTASFYFKNTNENDAEIGRKLAVRLLLRGSVRLIENQVKVTAQLTDVSNGFIIWAQSYDRELQDVFAIQNDIARRIVTSVTPVINPDEQIAAYSTDNLKAYNHYLRGRDYLRMNPTDTTLDSAESQFNKALRLDPAFVQAYAGLCQAKLEEYRFQSSTDDFDEAEIACTRALTRQGHKSKNWEVHLALGDLYREAGEAEESLAQIEVALSMRNDLPQMHISKARTLGALGLHDDAITSFQKAITINPGFWDAYLELANYYYNRPSPDYPAAIAAYQKVLELEPNYARALIGLGSVYYMNQQPNEAESAWQRAEESAENKGTLATLYSNRGLRHYYEENFTEAIEMQLSATRLAPTDHKYWGRLAESYRGIGDSSQEQAAYDQAILFGLEAEKVNPNDWETLGLLSLYHAHTGATEDTRRYQIRMLEIAQGNSTAFYFASLSSLAIGDYATAMAHIESAVKNGFSSELLANDPDLLELQTREPEKFQTLVTKPTD